MLYITRYVLLSLFIEYIYHEARSMFIILFEIDLLLNPTILFSPLIIHISVDIVYAGIKSPIKGMNSIVFIAVASSLPVILNKRLVVI